MVITCLGIALIVTNGIWVWRFFVLEEAFEKRYDEAATYWSDERELWRKEGCRFQERINGQIEENRRLRSRLEKAKTALWGDNKNGGW